MYGETEIKRQLKAIDEVTKKLLKSKRASKNFLVKNGFYTKDGKLHPDYCDKNEEEVVVKKKLSSEELLKKIITICKLHGLTRELQGATLMEKPRAELLNRLKKGEKAIKENKILWEGIEALRKGELTPVGFLAIFPLGKITKKDLKWASNVILERKKKGK